MNYRYALADTEPDRYLSSRATGHLRGVFFTLPSFNLSCGVAHSICWCMMSAQRRLSNGIPRKVSRLYSTLPDGARPQGGDQWVEAQTIFDTQHDHYNCCITDGSNTKRIFGPVLHLDIKEGKIWIQWNGTEDDIAPNSWRSVSPNTILCSGFHTPRMRQYTEYAVS